MLLVLEEGEPQWSQCGRSLMCILGLYDSIPAVIYGLGTSGPLKIRGEVEGEWRSPWDIRFSGQLSLSQRTQRTRTMGKKKMKLSHMVQEYDGGVGDMVGEWRVPWDRMLLRASSMAWPRGISQKGRWLEWKLICMIQEAQVWCRWRRCGRRIGVSLG